MHKELELWQFIAHRLRRDESAVLLVVAESSGSSPGRQGYKMAVAPDGELCGSIGGGVMEVNLVERAKGILSTSHDAAGVSAAVLIDQEHRKNSENPSGMICSGRQTVIVQLLNATNKSSVDILVTDLENGNEPWLVISETEFRSLPDETEQQNCPLPNFERFDDIFHYIDRLGPKNDLYIIGGGHCSLALSEIMSRLDFKVLVLDDRPELNTIKKNEFAKRITVLDGYDLVQHQILGGENVYVVVMTLGYASDTIVIRQLINHDFKYFGVLGSRAKMATLLKELRDEGLPANRLDLIRTPIGLPINSHTPEEIAVSIAAEIIAVKNARNDSRKS